MNAKSSNGKNLRIIAGSARGRRLRYTTGRGIRPFTDRIRESICTSVWNRFSPNRVLDLFAGSGIFGIEALSRGASHCTLVEQNRDCVRLIRDNIGSAGFEDRCRVVRCRAEDFLRTPPDPASGFDLISVDPPFGFGNIDSGEWMCRLLETLADTFLTDGGMIIYRAETGEEVFKRLPDLFPQARSRSFGRSCVTFIETSGNSDPGIPEGNNSL